MGDLDEPRPTRRASKRLASMRSSVAPAEKRPLSPAEVLALLNPDPDVMQKKRDEFEETGHHKAREKLRTLVGMTSKETEAERFLGMMKARGGGNIAVAWRRYFDSDGDGELSFNEFCAALIEFNYEGNVLTLWQDLRLHGQAANRDDDEENLRLEDLDEDSAAVLDFFGNWCEEKFGGPSEVFKIMDDDGSDSLTQDEFAEGLTALGFFDLPGVPASISSEELVTDNLFPLLDQTGTGACACEQVMFLEQNPQKKAKVLRQLARMREHGHEGAPEPLRNHAQRLLHQLAKQTTPLGGKPWQMVTSKVAIGEDWSHLLGSSSMSSKGLGKSLSSSSLRKPGLAKHGSSGLMRAGSSVLSFGAHGAASGGKCRGKGSAVPTSPPVQHQPPTNPLARPRSA